MERDGASVVVWLAGIWKSDFQQPKRILQRISQGADLTVVAVSERCVLRCLRKLDRRRVLLNRYSYRSGHEPHPRCRVVTGGLFDLGNGPMPRSEAADIVRSSHYLHSFPSGWTYCYHHDGAVVVFSIPANKNLAPYLFGGSVKVRELARLWAPNGHRANLLTEALALSLRALRAASGCEAVVSFADPNHGHHGGIYQAASWIYTGQSSETRVYTTPEGRTVSRRSFHSGSRSLIPEIAPRRLAGKHRYVKCLTRTSTRLLSHPAAPYPKPIREAVA